MNFLFSLQVGLGVPEVFFKKLFEAFFSFLARVILEAKCLKHLFLFLQESYWKPNIGSICFFSCKSHIGSQMFEAFVSFLARVILEAKCLKHLFLFLQESYWKP